MPDNFGMTVTKNPNSTFTLAGTLEDNYEPDSVTPSWPIGIDMPACNSTKEYGNWTMQVHQSVWWNTKDWVDFALPNVTATFDSKTANLTLDGTYLAQPYMRSNDSDWEGPKMVSDNMLHGIIQIRFRGVLDAYYSDVLDGNSTADHPEWLRTVGFGNNTANIGDSSDCGRSVRAAAMWSSLVIPFLVAIVSTT